jgi:hypothetical protein
MEPLLYPEEADVDGRAGVSIGDIFYLINYLFIGGPSPVPEMSFGPDGHLELVLPDQGGTK